ncbi:MAG: D-alanyl-D-alanine carboxypeptidase [Desulfovibrio sp.]|jgi:D-alanyl-D-alanine carboxypeptidase (penicillin-binding protein 5/6)|nr:D-alanyl-D-alanine carboxypeptidase [Desulfovibrio sp.]
MNVRFRPTAAPWRASSSLLVCIAALCCLLLVTPCHGAVPCRAAICVDFDSGQIYYSQRPDTPVAPASLTKVMTMFLAMDAVKRSKVGLKDKVKVSKLAAATGGSSMDLRRGDRVTLLQLLTGTAVASGNDAAMAVAEYIGGSVSRFVTQMNAKARMLGMRNTVFRNPTGLPAEGQKTSARDMATLARAYLRTHPGARNIHGLTFFRYRGRMHSATNSLLDGGMAGVDGLKTGWTVASGYNIIVTANRRGKRLVAVVLGARNKDRRDDAVRRLLSMGERGGVRKAVKAKRRR